MPRLQISSPSEMERVRPLTERVVRACAGAVPSVEHRLRVVVGEAIANAVRHGNGGVPHRRVRVTADGGAGEVRVAVQDEGEGFDPEVPPDPTGTGRRGRPGGRGLHLQRRLADEVRHEDDGRRVVLVLRRGP